MSEPFLGSSSPNRDAMPPRSLARVRCHLGRRELELGELRRIDEFARVRLTHGGETRLTRGADARYLARARGGANGGSSIRFASRPRARAVGAATRAGWDMIACMVSVVGRARRGTSREREWGSMTTSSPG